MLKVIMSKYPLLLVMAAGILAFVAVLVFTGEAVRASDRDDRIESSFKKTCVYNTCLKNEDIKISCKDGAVTLSGIVDDKTCKPMAQGIAGALPGVTSVDNQITVKAEQPARSSDTWISMKVKAALLYRRNVSGTKTKVYVKDGLVTLKGVAANQAQKDLTAEYAKNIAGVKGVQNEIVASRGLKTTGETQGEKISDTPITIQVRAPGSSPTSTVSRAWPTT
jgi:hyperosmotically inducible periplasmic protein